MRSCRRLLAALLFGAFTLTTPGVARADGAPVYNLILGIGMFVAATGLPGIAVVVGAGFVLNAKAENDVQPPAVFPQ